MTARRSAASAIVARMIRRLLASALAIVLVATGAFASDAAGTPTANLLTGTMWLRVIWDAAGNIRSAYPISVP